MIRQKQVLFLCLLNMMALCTEAGSVSLPSCHHVSLYRSRFCSFAFLALWLFVKKQVLFLCLLGMMALCTHFILMFRQKQVLFLCLLGMMALCTEAGSVSLPSWHDGSLYRSRFCSFAFLTSWLFVLTSFLCSDRSRFCFFAFLA